MVTKQQAETATLISTHPSSFRGPDVLSWLDSITQSLASKWDYLKELTKEILALCCMEDLEKEIEESSEWDTRIIEVRQKIEYFKRGSYGAVPASNINSRQTILQSSTPTRVINTENVGENGQSLPGPLLSGQSSHNQSMELSHSSVGTVGIRMPKISLPRFNREVTKFPTFWQSFDCAVYQNPGVSSVQKFSYLLSLLDGQAFPALQGLEITEENYEHAIEILNSRFGNKQQIINEHMSALLRLQSHPNEKVSHLRYILDSIIIHVRGLDSLGMPSERYDSLLIPIVMNRMPKEITSRVARKISQEIWSIEEILDIIRNEVEAREFSKKIAAPKPMERPVPPRPSQIQGTTQSFITKEAKGPPLCVLCKEGHLSLNCSKITDSKERKARILESRVCFCCLRPGHQAKTCDKKCRKCGGHHHQTICLKSSPRKETLPVESQVADSISASAKSKVNVLMMTASAFFYGEDSRRRQE